MKTKYYFTIFFLLPILIYSQIGYVPVEDEIYTFLNRMDALGIIENYNSFEIPKTRKEISALILKISKKRNQLDKIDERKLNDFLNEYEFEISSTLINSETLIPNWDFNYLLSSKEKYLYKYQDSTNASLFVNFVGKLDFLNQRTDNKSRTSFLYRFGGEIRGSLFNTIGFFVNTTNGSFTGNKELAQNFSSLKYNYKFHLTSGSDLGDNYFDETKAFLMADFNYAKIKIGNDRKLLGHGFNKVLLSDNAPRMEYLELNLKYKFVDFSFFHAKLLGPMTQRIDPIQGDIRSVVDKYFVYHRLGLNFGKHLKFGTGEMIIYANRNIDFSYLNPFNFYKSTEHANQDRDNSFLFFDFQNNSINGLKLYSTILIDDIDFGKLGTGWYGNKSLMSFGVFSSQLYNYFPVDFEFQYVKIDPYVFTHRISYNNFTNQNYSLGTKIEPNSSTEVFNIYYRPHYRVNIRLGYQYTIHGANKIDMQGNIQNFGGDISLGHRVDDPEEVYFLKGDKEILRQLSLSTQIQAIKNWYLFLKINYSNNSVARSQHLENFFTTFSIYTKI